MKYIVSILALFGFLFVLPQAKVKAEEMPTEPETTETETPKTEVEKKELEDFVIEIAEKYLGDYVDKQLIADIVVIATGVLGYLGLFITSIKYGKYKKGNVNEIIDNMKKVDAEHLKKLLDISNAKVEDLIKVNEELKQGYETIMKVLVLMQDSSAKGKVALLEYLGSKTNSQEVKEAQAEVKQELETQIETQKEVNEKVEGEYQDIF